MAVRLIFSLVMVLFLAGEALGQNDPDVVQPNDLNTKLEIEEEKPKEEVKVDSDFERTQSAKNVEKIQVTGSYVRRIDIEGPSPVFTVEKEDFEKAGVNTVTDYLRENSMFTGAENNGNRDGYFRFRGQHAGSTLILLNGLRVPKLGGPDRGFYNGVEAIPTNIIERVEILKDGSSALYGSDAMAGVMNFITRKDYDGAEYSNRVIVPEINKGLEQQHSIAFGKSYSNANWFATAQYVEQRGYTEADAGNYPTVPTTRASSNVNITTFDSDGEFNNNQRFEASCGPNTEECITDFRYVDMVRDPRENLGTLLSGRVDLTPDISVSALAMYNRRKRMDYGRPAFINYSQNEGYNRIPISELGSTELQSSLTGDTIELSALPFDEVGPENIAVLQNSYSAQAKIEGYYLDTWKWDLSSAYAYSLEERNHRNGLVDMDEVRGALVNGWNPANIGPQNTGVLNSARVQGVEAYEASLATARFLTTGELFEMNDVWGTGGPVSMAIGVEGQWETTADAHDDILIETDTNNNFLPNQQGSRTVSSFFTEFVMYPLDSVELQMAGRYDGYSDWGGTFNPKISVGYRPSRKVLLRSSWGTNFNAPSVRNMIQRDEISYERFRLCDQSDANCQDQTVGVTRYRDPSLSPEEGVNYNFGTVIQPDKRWTFTIDQWNFEGSNTISAVSSGAYSAIYNQIYNGSTPEADAAFEDLGVEIQRDAQGELISARIPAVTNMGERTIRGLDLNVNFNSPVRLLGRVVRLGLGMNHTHMLSYKTRTAPQLDFYYREDLEWKNTLSTSLSTKNHSYRLAARTLAGDTVARASIRTHTEYDFNYNFSIPWWSGKLALGVKNLLNTRPPVDRGSNLVDFTQGFNSYAFQALGRRYYVGYSHSF
jgi:iron complex outermembrane receptor protein